MLDPPPALVRPVPGPVAVPYRYHRRAPFAPGQRRVLRLAAGRGQPVRAPCAGVVRFAGRTPRGPTVALRCGGWAVTLGGVRADGRGRRGRTVAGTVLGRAAAPVVALGVRAAGDRFGYVDPAPLLRGRPRLRRFAPVGPAPRSRPPGTVPGRVRRPRPVPRPAPALRTPLVAPRGDPTGTPVAGWIGLGVLALGLPSGLAAGRRGRARRAAATAHAGGAR